MIYTVQNIARIIGAENAELNDSTIEHLLLDSRKVHSPGTSLFFAIKGIRRDGHQFVPELYAKGVRSFVVSQDIEIELYPEGGFLFVNDTLEALQLLAAHHRQQFNIPVIGITGSNGKTIVKEWLYQLLYEDFNIIRSPKSYNSQIGVPLSVWQMNEQHTLAIFEAGISQQGEMLQLEKIIRPVIGVLTNIGEAHSEGFIDHDHKFREKLTLFKNSNILIGKETDFVHRSGVKEILDMFNESLQVLTWGESESENEFILKLIEKNESHSTFTIGNQIIEIPFSDDASIENAITCYCVMCQLNIAPEVITQRMLRLQPVNMRLELKKGINNCSLINDSYSADLSSLEIALNFLDQQSAGAAKTVILSDFLQSSVPDDLLYEMVFESLVKHRVKRVIGIGNRISTFTRKYLLERESLLKVELFTDTTDYLKHFRSSQYKDESILIKGARIFAFEQIVQQLELKAHQTVLEINLNAIAHNLKEYQNILRPSTKVMAMVKAFAYGSGGSEIAGILQYHKVDYLGVAYADEGVELRKTGITIPIMVMNPEENAFEAIVENELEPEIYSFEILQSFDRYLLQSGLQQYPVHIEIETGMNRLGFATSDIGKLCLTLLSTSSFKVQSVFTHLSASEDPAADEFTRQQLNLFNSATNELELKLGYSFIKHIANSAAALRHPDLQMDMIRLGIGLYGVDSSNTGKLNLQTVATLKSTIAQLKRLNKGESVSYNRKGQIEKETLIATIRLGYADGFPRRLGNGVGKVWINSKLAPVIGTVCMDMFMVDVTGIADVQIGNAVTIFGKELPVATLAKWADTIPYEIMTGVSQRVKRVYFEE